jgi:hypothetical protein
MESIHCETKDKNRAHALFLSFSSHFLCDLSISYQKKLRLVLKIFMHVFHHLLYLWFFSENFKTCRYVFLIHFPSYCNCSHYLFEALFYSMSTPLCGYVWLLFLKMKSRSKNVVLTYHGKISAHSIQALKVETLFRHLILLGVWNSFIWCQ